MSDTACNNHIYQYLVDLLSRLREQGVTVAATSDGAHLHVEAPAGALTGELRQALKDHKSALLAHLRPKAATNQLEVYRIPLDAYCPPSEWLAQRGLRIIDGTPRGPNGRPFLWLADLPEGDVA